MNSKASNLSAVIRFFAVGLLISLAIFHGAREANSGQRLLAPAEVDDVCKSVTGCKSITIASDHVLRVTESRRSRNPVFSLQIKAALEQKLSGAADYTIEVFHE